MSRIQPPIELLLRGKDLLEPVLKPHRFRFHLGERGRGSGGDFAYGSYRRRNMFRSEREIEFHVRYSLGLVAYHIGAAVLDHESYMRFLGVWGQNRYPSFAKDVLDQFAALASDIEQYCGDFVHGDGAQFIAFADKLKAEPLMFKGLPQ